MNGRYILVDKKPVPCDDLAKWAKWIQTTDRTVIRTEREGYLISTVFLGLDNSCSEGAPLLFESMCFPQKNKYKEELDCMTYSTWKEAQDGHVEMCQKFLTGYTEEDMFLDML